MAEIQRHRPRVVGPGAIVAPTSGRCQADYGLLGYDLRTLRRGEQLADNCADFRLWVELAVVAHLTGRPTSRIPPSTMAQVVDEELAVLNAAIAYAVDQAVADRSPACHDRFRPADLAAHIARALQLHLWEDCTRDPCPKEARWTGTPFLANLVLGELAEHAAKTSNRHPRTTTWEARLGIRLAGRTAAEQLHEAQWLWATAHSVRRVQTILFGSHVPSWLERYVEADRADERWPDAVARAVSTTAPDDLLVAVLQSTPGQA